MPETANTPCVLIVRDGWGRNPNAEHDAFNAVKLAQTPVDERLMAGYPSTLIRTSGLDVGLPEGTMGNSEVGHQNIGAGRIVDQESVRITKACRAGELAQNEAIAQAVGDAQQRGGNVHLMCICSDAGVHGLLEHLFAAVRACKELGQSQVFVHLLTDGRDTGPYTGKGYIEEVEREFASIGAGTVASVIGRYWAMDRDHRWERVERAYACLTGRNSGGIASAPSAIDAIQRHYDSPSQPNLAGDEFTPPTMIDGAARIADGDSVVFVNYRGDRPREIVSAFVLPDAEWAEVKPSPESGARGFDRGPKPDIRFVGMTAYSVELARHMLVAFPKPPKMKAILGEHLSALGLRQFRCAETEKFPHVTFFFNDYRDDPFEGEGRAICPSPKDVATYDQKPEMSAFDIRDAVLARLEADDTEPAMIVNFANPDMVGHTGSLEATVKACETVDACVGAIVDATLKQGGSLIVTADHGNAEQMFDPATGAPHTAHTTYDVPLIVVGEAFEGRSLRENGRLADIAPTMLDMMELGQPAEMTGASLLA